jgi:hypothetical protein
MKTSKLIIIDIINILAILILGCAFYGSSVLIITEFSWKAFPLAILISLLSYFTILTIFRMMLPKLKAGNYSLDDRHALIWFLHLCLNRSSKALGIFLLIRASRIFTYLYYRSLGARISFNSSFSTDLEIADPSLTTISEGAIVGGRCYLGCHVIKNGKLTLGPVSLERNSFVCMNTVIGPGTIISEDAITGTGNYFVNQTLPKGYELPNFEWSELSPNLKKKTNKLRKKNLEDRQYFDFHQRYSMIEDQ